MGHREGWNLESWSRLSLLASWQARRCCQESVEMPLSEVRSFRNVRNGPWQRWLCSRIQTASIFFQRSRPIAIWVWVSVRLAFPGGVDSGLMRHDAATGGNW